MEQWSNLSIAYRDSEGYMMETGNAPNIMDMDISACPPRMMASDDIQINCYQHVGISEQPVSPEVQKGRISPTYARAELAKKLLNRRSIGELRQQNYTSGLAPEIHANRAKLQRAQTTDLLNKKITKRPDSDSLVYNNILRTGHSTGSKSDVDPSLICRQQELAKAQLEDEIKQHLETRPGPLELVKNNIMQLSEPLNNVIKNGQVNFKVNTKHPNFNKYRDQRSPDNIFDTTQVSPENALSPASQASDDMSLYQDDIIKQDTSLPCSEPFPKNRGNSGAKSSPKVRRKNQKAKVWKFKYHEYKHPGQRDKSGADKPHPNDTPHDIIMKQQQLLLQLQVMQKNYPNYILPKTLDVLNEIKEKNGNTAPSESHLNGMKVSALKEELKKRNLNTYGNKSQLVERLRPYVDKDVKSPSNSRSKEPLQRSNSEGDMLASPGTMLNQQQARKGSQPILSLDDVLLNSTIRQNHIAPGGMVNSNPSSNDAFDSENCSIIDNLGSLMVAGGGDQEYIDPDPYKNNRHTSPEQPRYQEVNNQYSPTSYSQLLEDTPGQQHIEVPQPLPGQSPQHSQQQQQAQQPPATSLQQQYIQQFPGQQVHGVIATQQPLLSNARQPHFSGHQFPSPPHQPAQFQQDMIPIPQVQPINNVYFNMQTQFRASNPPTASQPSQQLVQLPQQQQYMIVQQPQQHQQQQSQKQQQQPQQQQVQQQFTSNEQYAVVPPQYLNTSLQQLRQVQQPRFAQQQVHQQRLNNQYQLAPHGQQAPDSLNIEGSRDAKNSISTPDVISIILGSPNTTPMLKRGDKVGDPFSTQHKDEQMIRYNSSRQASDQMAAERQQMDRQQMDRQQMDRQQMDREQMERQQLDRQLSTEDWLAANMPQDLLTPDTANFPKLMTPGGDSVFEFSNDHILNNFFNSDQMFLSNPATSQPGVAR